MTDKKKPGPKPKEPEAALVTIQCTCSNVHLGNGHVLRATKNAVGNWVKGDTAKVTVGIAEMMEENGQVKIL